MTNISKPRPVSVPPDIAALMLKVPRPSKAEAAAYLRRLAFIAKLTPLNPEEREHEEQHMRLRLFIIADYIEKANGVQWRKGRTTVTLDQDDLIRFFARLADARQFGVRLADRLDRLAPQLADLLGLKNRNTADRATRAHRMIVEARKQQRKLSRGK